MRLMNSFHNEFNLVDSNNKNFIKSSVALAQKDVKTRSVTYLKWSVQLEMGSYRSALFYFI